MFAQLGNIEFNRLLGFEGLDSTKETNLVEQPLIDSLPVLQRIGTKLENPRMTIRLDASFCIPSDVIAQLDASREASEIMPLIFGNGEVVGDFVIKGITRSYEQCADDGTLLHSVVTLDLLQSESITPAQAIKSVETQAVAQGFANPVNTPETFTPFAEPQTPAAEAMGCVVDTSADVNTIGEGLNDIVQNPDTQASGFQNMVSNINRITDNVNTAISIINGSGQQIYDITRQLETNLNFMASSVQNFATTLQGGNLQSAITAHAQMQTIMGNTLSSAAPLTAFKIFQK